MEQKVVIEELKLPPKAPDINFASNNCLSLRPELLDEQYNIKEMRCLYLSRIRLIAFIIIGLVFCLIPFLLYKWFLRIRLLLYIPVTFDPSNSYGVTHILVLKKDSDWEICSVDEAKLPENVVFHVRIL